MSSFYPVARCDAYARAVFADVQSKVMERVLCPECGASLPSTSGLGLGVPDLAAVKEDTTASEDLVIPPPDVNTSAELTAREHELLEKEISALSAEMARKWDKLATEEKWDEVKADLSVYRLSGETVTSDPGREEAYRKTVVEGLLRKGARAFPQTTWARVGTRCPVRPLLSGWKGRRARLSGAWRTTAFLRGLRSLCSRIR